MKKLTAAVKVPILLTAAFTAFVVIIKYPFNHFWARFDIYYHAIHAQSYVDGFDVTYPAFTFFSKYPADVWYLYHLAVAGVYYLGNFITDISIEEALACAHIIFSAALMFTLLWFFRVTFTFFYDKDEIHPLWYISFIAVLTCCFSVFTVRAFFYERPHVLMITLVVIAMIALIQKRYLLLFIASLLAPLTYSFSLFVFIPLVTLLAGLLLVDKKIIIKNDEFDRVVFTTIAGFVVGVFLHPSSIGYVVNGVGFHTFAILQSLMVGIPFHVGQLLVPEEMTLMQEELPIFHSLLGAALLLSIDLKRRINAQNDELLHRKKVVFAGMLTMSLIMLFASVFVSRAVEYAIPLAVVTVFVALPLIATELKAVSKACRDNQNSKFGGILRSGIALTAHIATHRWQLRLSGFLSGAFLLLLTLAIYSYYSDFIQTGEVDYSGAGKYLATVASKDELIIQTQFAAYPALLKEAPELQYAVGMDPRMVYFFDPDLSYLYSGLFKGAECHNRECPYTRGEALARLQERYNIRYIMVDDTFYEADVFQEFSQDETYELVYTDPDDDRIRVYKIREQ